MAEAIISFFEGLGLSKTALAAVLAVVPVTEIKGAVLFASATEGSAFPAVFVAYLASVLLSAMLAVTVPRTLAIARRSAFAGKAASFFADRLGSRADKIASNAEKRGRRDDARVFGVFAFVAIPLPLTGIWAGALLSALLGLKGKDTFFALSAGNFCAGGIVLVVALLAGDKASVVLELFLCLAIVVLLFTALKSLFARLRRAKEASDR